MIRSRITIHVLRLTFCLAIIATRVSAHDRTTSYSTWDIRDHTAHITVRLSQLDVSRFPWAAEGTADAGVLGGYLTSHLQLFAGQSACAVTDGPRALSAAPGHVVYEWRLTCAQTDSLQVRSGLLLDVAPTHLHFARISCDGGAAVERVLSAREPTWSLASASPTAATESSGTSLPEYLGFGIEHILTGYDHLAFVLALLLIGGSLGEVAKVVTGFTVAHSITLGLTVLGYVRPDRAPVEALIGLSIALVAAENIWLATAFTTGRGRAFPRVIAAALALLALAAACGYGRVPALTLAGLALFSICYFGLRSHVARAASLRWGIAFIFGLVHGFGFASVLIEARLPTERLVQALFGFNLGVEVGQLAVVAVVWPLLRLIARRGEGWRLAVLNYGSAAVLALGVFLFVSRTFG